MINLCIAIVLQLQAQGLESGESFHRLAKMVEHPAPYTLVHGRVLDAFTGRPLAGAKIETWSEEIDETFGGYHRLGEARSRRDGRFTIRQQVGSIQAEKARISAPGYLTWSGVRGDLYDIVRVFPRMKQIPRLRILDLQGRPIEGARITSTYTCAHDIPAFDLRTDSSGTALLREFGLQDEIQELRVRAPGFQSLKYLDVEAMFAGTFANKPYDVQLSRQRPFQVRVLGRDGRTLSDVPIHIDDGDGYIVERTDKQGLISVLTRYDVGELGMRILGGPRPNYIANFSPPVGRVPTLRISAEEWPENTRCGTLRLDMSRLPADSSHDPDIQLFHEEGWFCEIHPETKDATRFPVGKAILVIGGAFSGFEQEIHDLVFATGIELKVQPKLRPETEIQVTSPKKGRWTLSIQADVDTNTNCVFDEPIPVPHDRQLVLILMNGEHRLIKKLESPKSGTKINFANELAALAAPVDEPKRFEQELHFVSSKDGKPLKGRLSIQFGPDCTQSPGDEAIEARYKISGPAGTAWLAHFTAEGHSAIYVRGHITEGAAPIARRVDALARLDIQAPFAFKILGEDALDLDALPPGPLGLELLLENGRRYGLQLELAAGAVRRIQIR